MESAFGGSVESGDRSSADAFGKNLPPVAVKRFSHLIYYIQTFKTLSSLNTIFRENATINFITVQRKKINIRQL